MINGRVIMQTTEAATDNIIRSANGGSYAGAGVSMIGLLTTTEWAALGGFLVALLSALVSIHFNQRRDKREQLELDRRDRRDQEQHEIKMRRYSKGLDSDRVPL